MHRFGLIVATCLIFVICGCASKDSTGVRRQYSLGFTVVTIPKSAPARPDFGATEVKTVGLSFIQGSASLGFSKTKRVALPSEGALYVEVKTAEQFEAMRTLIQAYPNKNICVTQKTD